MSHRLSVNINPECADVLRKVKDERGISTTEAVRRAVAYLGFVEALHHRGGRIVLEGREAR